MRVTDSADLGRAFLVRRGSRILRGVGRESSAGSAAFCDGELCSLRASNKTSPEPQLKENDAFCHDLPVDLPSHSRLT